MARTKKAAMKSKTKRKFYPVEGAAVPSVGKLKKQIRSLTRLLNKPGLPEDVKQAKQAELDALQGQMPAAQKEVKVQKLTRRYKAVMFVERQKVVRKINQLKRKLAAVHGVEADEEDDQTEEEAKLRAEMDVWEGHLDYIDNYPRGYKYVALFPSEGGDKPETEKQRDAIRRMIARARTQREAEADGRKFTTAQKAQFAADDEADAFLLPADDEDEDEEEPKIAASEDEDEDEDDEAPGVRSKTEKKAETKPKKQSRKEKARSKKEAKKAQKLEKAEAEESDAVETKVVSKKTATKEQTSTKHQTKRAREPDADEETQVAAPRGGKKAKAATNKASKPADPEPANPAPKPNKKQRGSKKGKGKRARAEGVE